MKYRREIDGLRAIAVLPVIFFHAGFSTFSGGYVGVDIFFVISGYLITSILIGDLKQENFSILRFYKRRALRIFPALFTVMIACIPFAYMWMLPVQFVDFVQSFIAVIFFVSNILFWLEDGYFAAAAELKPLLHTWSLAVEEQYYLIFPISLASVWKFGRYKAFWCIVAIAVLSLLLSEWGWRNRPSANFYLAPARAWELLAGSICAFLITDQKHRTSNTLSTLGLALIVFSIFYYDKNVPFPSIYALAPVCGTMLIILYATPGTWTARLLSTRAFVGIGLISYSAYLWHQPLFAFARIRSLTEPGPCLLAALAAAALMLAWGTWRWVEQPFRSGSDPTITTRHRLFVVRGAAAAIFLMIGLAGLFSDDLKRELTPQEKLIAQYSDYPSEAYYRQRTCFLEPEQNYGDFDSDCWTNTSTVVFGDSHAAALSSYLSSAHDFGQLTASACPPIINFNIASRAHCSEINLFVLDKLSDLKPEFVFLSADWHLYEDIAGFRQGLRATLEHIKANGSKAVVVGGVPQFIPSLPIAALKQQINFRIGTKVYANQEELLDLNASLKLLAIETEALYWDPISRLCDEGQNCLAIVPSLEVNRTYGDAALITWDYGHLTFSGASFIGQLLMQYIATKI